MLIFDGSDLVGKSALVQRACELLNARGLMHMPMHLTRPPGCWDACHGYVEKMSVHAVWDRFHLSELAYRACDDRPSQLTPVKLDLVEAHLRLIGGYSCVVTASDAVIRARHAERSDAMYSLEHILRVNEAFKTIVCQRAFQMRGQTYRYHVDRWFHLEEATDAGYASMSAWLEDVVDCYVTRLEEMGLEFVEVSPGGAE